MAANELEAIMIPVQRLSPDEQLLLIKRVTEMLVQEKQPKEPRYLVYGEFRDAPGEESTEEDFRLAEWHPMEEQRESWEHYKE
jgi:hypothetical protein